jgi:hypothetical protein
MEFELGGERWRAGAVPLPGDGRTAACGLAGQSGEEPAFGRGRRRCLCESVSVGAGTLGIPARRRGVGPEISLKIARLRPARNEDVFAFGRRLRDRRAHESFTATRPQGMDRDERKEREKRSVSSRIKPHKGSLARPYAS